MDSSLTYHKMPDNFRKVLPSYMPYAPRGPIDNSSGTMNKLLALSYYNQMMNTRTIPQNTQNPFMFHMGKESRLLQSSVGLNRSINALSRSHYLKNAPCNSSMGNVSSAYVKQRYAEGMSMYRDSSKRNIRERSSHGQKRTVDWEDRLQVLIDFKNEHGHCMVPQNHPELGAWVKWQREKYALFEEGRTSYFTPEKIERLNEIGFVWRVRRKRKKNVVKKESEKVERRVGNEENGGEREKGEREKVKNEAPLHYRVSRSVENRDDNMHD